MHENILLRIPITPMKLTTDEVLERIGSFGRYQIVLNIYFNIAYALWWAFPVMAMVFIASEPGWKCKNNSTCPFTDTISLGDDRYKHRCDIPRQDWDFADDFTSVVTEFDLYCKRGALGFVSTSVIFAGFIAGSISVSPISDKFGRKLPLFVCGFFCAVFNFVSAFSPAFWVFALFRAIVGFMIGAYSIPLFVLTSEFSGVRRRGTAGSVVWIGYEVFVMLLAAIAYGIRDWRQLIIVTGVPGIIFAAGYFFIPESVRWLLKKGRYTEAKETLAKVASLNGTEMPDEPIYLPKEERLGDIRDLFSSLKMAHKTLGCWFMWFAVSFISWGMNFSTPFVGGSVYSNEAISAGASLPSYLICAVLTVWFGRRKSLFISFLAASLGAIGALLMTDKAEHDNGFLAGKIFMSMVVAKLSSGVAFTLVYIYAAELFPTALRNVAMGTSTSWARVSGFASAYAPLLLEIHRFLPFGIMAGLALAAAVICLTLPETHDQPMIEDLSQDSNDKNHKQDENLNANDVTAEENTLL